jgi:hypothetical protein
MYIWHFCTLLAYFIFAFLIKGQFLEQVNTSEMKYQNTEFLLSSFCIVSILHQYDAFAIIYESILIHEFN